MVKRRSSGSLTWRAGLVGGVVMVLVHLVLQFVTQGSMIGQWMAMLIGWFVYFAVGRSAAQQVKELLEEEYSYHQAVRSAGMGAAVITSLLTWVFNLIFNVFRDAMGFQVPVNPWVLCSSIVIDLSLAAGLGAFGSRTVLRSSVE